MQGNLTMTNAKHTIVTLAADEKRALKNLKFTTRCKNDGSVYSYDFGARQRFKELEQITGIFVWALYKRRNRMGHISRQTQRENFWKFLYFLDEQGIQKPQELVRQTLVMYVRWLKQQEGLGYSTAAAHFRLLSPTFREMSKHPDISEDFIPQANPFPKSSSLQTPGEGYDQQELKSILRAAVMGMRETLAKYTIKYKSIWIGKPAPLEDVAPLSLNGGHSFWNSLEYKIWWWENHCNCQRLNSGALSRIRQGQVFMGSFKTSNQTAMAGVYEFYDLLGAGVNYVPKYYQKPCPIKYITPWKKIEYLVWYWENNHGCQVMTDSTLQELAPEMYRALKEHFNGRNKEFFQNLGLYAWIATADLIPFYIMLLVRTQLNPSTVQRLRTDSLIDDPLDPTKQIVSWVKYRSSQSGIGIPSDQTQDGWPVMLINKVIDATASFREVNQSELWIANSNSFKKTLPIGSSSFKKGMRDFSIKYNLKDKSGAPLFVQAQLIRPTMAWQEYLRTEDIRYLKALLGHAKISTTADYLRRKSDPLFKIRRGVHINAMFTDVLSSSQIAGSEPTNAKGLMLNSCSNPLKSPIHGQKDDTHCTASHEICLSCPNLVVTHEDIKSYFCFIRYYEKLLDSGLIELDDYERAISNKKMVWEGQILKRYEPDLIAAIRVDSELRPVGVWSAVGEAAWL